MLTPEEQDAVAATTRTMQIIIIALVAGVAAYLTFAILNRAEPGDDTLAMIGVMFTIATVAAAVVVPNIILGQQRRAIAEGKTAFPMSLAGSDAAQLLGAYQTQKIIRAALFEGPAFMNTFVYQSGGPPYSLGIAIALMLAIVALLPFRRSLEDWLDRELRTVRELRDMRR
jgi:xanthosine utilization system XapX-like protein